MSQQVTDQQTVQFYEYHFLFNQEILTKKSIKKRDDIADIEKNRTF